MTISAIDEGGGAIPRLFYFPLIILFSASGVFAFYRNTPASYPKKHSRVRELPTVAMPAYRQLVGSVQI